MKFLLWLLGLFAAAVALTLAAHNNGYMLLVYPPYRIEMSLTLFVLSLLAFFLLGYMLLRIVLSAMNLPEFVRRFRAERLQKKGRSAMMEALAAFFEGRYAAAEKAAVRAMDLGERSGINPIIAARAAHELREFDKRDTYLAAAEGKSVGEATMRLMAQSKFMLDQQQPQSALNALKQLRDSGVKGHIGALQMELKAQQLAQNWDGVLEVLVQLEKRAVLDAAVIEQMRQQAYVGKLRRAHGASELQGIWKSIPGNFRRGAKVAAAAASIFIQLKDCAMAQRILSDSLDEQWDSSLLELYGECTGGEVVTRIERAEGWLRQHPDDASLLLALGRLCLHQGLWGKAQNYLEASISVAPSRAAYTALAQLLEKLHKPDEAFRYYQKSLELAKSAG
ncbi:MAG: heme biosynthesis protein HemY [Sideroxydans sp.]|nr:heme biosynthesis protein HemY [Sideroxydans sp.]